MENNKNSNQEPNNMQYMPICMSIGISVGLAIGSALGNIGVGMCIGLSIGMGIGVAIDSMNKKKKNEKSDADKKGEE